MTATFYVGDVLDVLGKLPENSVDLILSSPPFLALRSYLPADHPLKEKEGGSQSTPGEYIDWLLDVVEACDRVLAPHGSLCFELGDTYAGSGEGGGDFIPGSGQFSNPARLAKATQANGPGRKGTGWPLPKSLSLIPESFRFAMVYGFNPFTGRQTERWRLRNVIRWVRPNPPVGALGDKFRPATSELMVFCKSAKRFFDLDAVREPYAFNTLRGGTNGGELHKKRTLEAEGTGRRPTVPGDVRMLTHEGAPPLDWWNIPLLEGDEPTKYGPKPDPSQLSQGIDKPAGHRTGERSAKEHWASRELAYSNPLGAPPLDWWNIPPGGYSGAHYAVWPEELLIKPIKAMCPEHVCRTCGEARRRILNDRFMWDRQPALAAHIREQRVAAGYSLGDVDNWFGFKDGAAHWERTDKSGANIPTPEVWPVLKERLGLSAEFDDMINGGNLGEYIGLGPNGRVNKTESPYQTRRADGLIRPAPTFTDCGHDDYRNGVVLDPFVGSGTTLAVASGHGRNAIGIDLDERNYSLALERVGPLVLQRGEVAA